MLYFTIGIARSGKSTFCSNWVKEKPNRAIVCSDNIRLALHGQRFQPLAEPMVEAIKIVMIRTLLDRGMDVIVDGTHTTEHSIKKLLDIDKNAIAFYFDTSKELCLERALLTNQPDLYEPIKRMSSQLEELVLKDIFFNLVRVHVNSSRKLATGGLIPGGGDNIPVI